MMPSRFISVVDNKSLVVEPSLHWLKNNIHYEVIMGSQAYGVSNDASDEDIYGWAIPPKYMIFPNTIGHIDGFGPAPERFDQFQQHHVNDALTGKQYDFVIYNVVKYMSLVLENNPNMIDSLFVPNNCVMHITQAGSIIRDNRKSFLHKGVYAKFRGYAHSQVHKMHIKKPNANTSSKRSADIEHNGFDTKFAYHIVRLLHECEQILTYQDLDLQKSKAVLKAIRNGEVDYKTVLQMIDMLFISCEQAYQKTKLPDGPDWKHAQQLLMDVLESHYGNLAAVVQVDRSQQLLSDLNSLINKYGK
jgi:predicted nucleotidyltransferase